MRFKLTFAPTADQSFSLLPRWVQNRFNHTIELLERAPRRASADLDLHQLYGYANVWTLRIPPYRGIDVIDRAEVEMVAFGHRDVVYSTLHRLIPPRRPTVSKATPGRRR
jgi:mRNA-degrading endonuclease RelE of RelBE toxin-antitoxin system